VILAALVEELARRFQHEKRTRGRLKAELAERVREDDWPAWYAAYMVAEQAGTEPPT
jgi:hypothetical protein